MPEALSDEEIADMVKLAIADASAESVRDMGKVMAILKPKLQGRADVGSVSQIVKKTLS